MSDWYQQQLTPTEVYELNIRLGIIPSTDHAQALVEVKDPMTNILIAQWSGPHTKWDAWPALLDRAAAKAYENLGLLLDPF